MTNSTKQQGRQGWGEAAPAALAYVAMACAGKAGAAKAGAKWSGPVCCRNQTTNGDMRTVVAVLVCAAAAVWSHAS